MEIIKDTAAALWQVLVVCVLLGAGLPALFALGLKTLNAGRTVNPDGTISDATGAGNKVLAYGIFGFVIAVALFGIVAIVFGKQLFAH